MPLVTMNSDLAVGAGENNTQIEGRHGGTVANASSTPGTPGGPGTPAHSDEHSAFHNINNLFTTEFPNPEGAYNPTLEIDGTLSSIGLPNTPYLFNSISDLAIRYNGIQNAGQTNLYPNVSYAIDPLSTEQTSLHTITNPTTYTPANSTFSNTTTIQDGNYTQHKHPSAPASTITRDGDFGNSILLTGGVNTKYPGVLGDFSFNSISDLAVRYDGIHNVGTTNLYPHLNQNTGIFEKTTILHTITNPTTYTPADSTFSNTSKVGDDGTYTGNHTDNPITRTGDFGSATSLKTGTNTKYPKTLGETDFNNTPSIDVGGEYTPKQYTGTSVTPSGDYGSSILLTGGVPLKVPEIVQAVTSQFGNSVGQKAFKDTEYPVKLSDATTDIPSPLNTDMDRINKEYTDADGYYSDIRNFKTDSMIRDDSNRGPGAGGGFGVNEPFLIFNPKDDQDRRDKINNRMLPIQSTIDDVKRIAQFAVSSRGGWFLVKQFMLQLQNQRSETQLFNPIKFYLTTLPFVHLTRHSVLEGSRYEDYVGYKGGSTLENIDWNNLGLSKTGISIDTINSVDNRGKHEMGRLNKLRKTLFPGGIPASEIASTRFLSGHDDLTSKDVIDLSNPTEMHATGVPNSIWWQRVGGPAGLILRFRTQRASPQRAVNSQVNFYGADSIHIDSPSDTILLSYEEIMAAAASSVGHSGGESGNYEKKGSIGVIEDKYKEKEGSFDSRERIENGKNDGTGVDIVKYDLSKTLYTGNSFNLGTGDTSDETQQDSIKKIWFSKSSNVNRVGVLLNGTENSVYQDKRGNQIAIDDSDMVSVKFAFKATEPLNNNLITNKLLIFRAYITGISDTFTTDYNNIQFMGRPDKVYTYKGGGRKIGFTLEMHPNSRIELIPMYEKLNQLCAMCYPDFEGVADTETTFGQRMVAPFCKLTIGNLYNDMWGYVDNVSVTFDDKGTWEIDKGARVPRYVKATVSYEYIGNKLPSINTNFYNILDQEPIKGKTATDNYDDKTSQDIDSYYASGKTKSIGELNIIGGSDTPPVVAEGDPVPEG